MAKRQMMAGLGAAIMGFGAMGSGTDAAAAMPERAPAVEESHVIVVDRAGTSAVMAREKDGALVPADAHRRWAAGAIAGALAAAFLGTFGVNAILRAFTQKPAPRSIDRTAQKASIGARARKGAASLASGLAEPVGKSADLALRATLLVAALGAGAIIFDLSWKASAVIGAAAAAGGAVGYVRQRRKTTDQETAKAFSAAASA